MTINGQCACGAAKLEINADPVAQFYCHCDDCQTMHAASLVGVVMFPAAAVNVAGPIEYQKRNVTPRATCSDCGSRLFAEPPGMGLRGVYAAALPAEIFKPAFHVNCRYASVRPADGLPHFKGLPAAFGGSDETVAW